MLLMKSRTLLHTTKKSRTLFSDLQFRVNSPSHNCNPFKTVSSLFSKKIHTFTILVWGLGSLRIFFLPKQLLKSPCNKNPLASSSAFLASSSRYYQNLFFVLFLGNKGCSAWHLHLFHINIDDKIKMFNGWTVFIHMFNGWTVSIQMFNGWTVFIQMCNGWTRTVYVQLSNGWTCP